MLCNNVQLLLERKKEIALCCSEGNPLLTAGRRIRPPCRSTRSQSRRTTDRFRRGLSPAEPCSAPGSACSRRGPRWGSSGRATGVCQAHLDPYRGRAVHLRSVFSSASADKPCLAVVTIGLGTFAVALTGKWANLTSMGDSHKKCKRGIVLF